MDFRKYRMIDLKWTDEYKERLGKEVFFKFVDVVYGWLMALKPGQSLSIANHAKVTDRNRELVVKVCDLFIQEGNIMYEFNEEYTIIKNNNYVPRINKSKSRKAVAK